MNDAPLLLVDFNNAAWRSAHALKAQDMTYRGADTSISFGVLSEIGRVMERFASNRIILCGDHPGGPTLRKALFPGYKDRKGKYGFDTEEDIQFRAKVARGMLSFRDALRETCKTNPPWYVHSAGYEADDIIACLCQVFADERKVIVSNDKDLFQLLDADTKMYRPGTGRFATGPVMMVQDFVREYKVTPDKWNLVKALAGCTSDKIPGIRGIGEKTACAYYAGELSAKRKEKIDARFKLYENVEKVTLFSRLTKIPFDSSIVTFVKCVFDGKEIPRFTEAMWNKLSAKLGITKLHYPRIPHA